MPSDKPNFLQGVDDDTQDINEIVGDGEIEPTEKEPDEQPKEEVSNDDTKGDSQPDVSKDETTTGELDEQEKKPEEEKEEPDKAEETDKKEESSDPEKKEEPKEEKNFFGTFKTAEDAEKAYKELQAAFTRANQTIEGYKKGVLAPGLANSEELDKIARTQLIFPETPDVADYTNEDGTVNLDGYMKQYTSSLITSIQKSLLAGPLAAAQFGILKNALLEEHGNIISEGNAQRQAEEITNKLYQDFPILKTDKDKEDIVSQAITGAKMVETEKAKAEGREPVFDYNFYSNIVTRVLGVRKGEPVKEEEEPTEKVKGSPTVSFNQQPVDEMDEIISGMERVGKKGQLF